MKNNRIYLLMAMLLFAVMLRGQNIALTNNGDGTWALAAMPAFDVCLQVEYENNSDSIPVTVDEEIYLRAGKDGVWVLDSMPAFDAIMEIEYEDIEIAAIDSVTTVVPGYEAEPGKNVTTQSGINISLNEYDTVDPEEGSITMHSTYTTNELVNAMKSAAPGSLDFANYFKGVYFLLAAGKGQVELDIETFGNFMMSVMSGDMLIGNYVKTTKGTIVINYDLEEDTWFLTYPSVTTPSGVRRAKTSDTDGGLKLYSIRIIPEEVYDPDGIEAPRQSPADSTTVYDLAGRRVLTPRKGLYIMGGKVRAINK